MIRLLHECPLGKNLYQTGVTIAEALHVSRFAVRQICGPIAPGKRGAPLAQDERSFDEERRPLLHYSEGAAKRSSTSTSSCWAAASSLCLLLISSSTAASRSLAPRAASPVLSWGPWGFGIIR